MEVKIEKRAKKELRAFRLRLYQVFRSEGFRALDGCNKLPNLFVQIYELNRVRVVIGVFKLLQRPKFYLPLVLPRYNGDYKSIPTEKQINLIRS